MVVECKKDDEVEYQLWSFANNKIRCCASERYNYFHVDFFKLAWDDFVDINFRQLLTMNSQNVGSGYIIKPSTMVWMGQHQKFDFIAKDLDFEKNRLCTGSSITFYGFYSLTFLKKHMISNAIFYLINVKI